MSIDSNRYQQNRQSMKLRSVTTATNSNELKTHTPPHVEAHYYASNAPGIENNFRHQPLNQQSGFQSQFLPSGGQGVFSNQNNTAQISKSRSQVRFISPAGNLNTTPLSNNTGTLDQNYPQINVRNDSSTIGFQNRPSSQSPSYVSSNIRPRSTSPQPIQNQIQPHSQLSSQSQINFTQPPIPYLTQSRVQTAPNCKDCTLLKQAYFSLKERYDALVREYQVLTQREKSIRAEGNVYKQGAILNVKNSSIQSQRVVVMQNENRELKEQNNKLHEELRQLKATQRQQTTYLLSQHNTTNTPITMTESIIQPFSSNSSILQLEHENRELMTRVRQYEDTISIKNNEIQKQRSERKGRQIEIASLHREIEVHMHRQKLHEEQIKLANDDHSRLGQLLIEVEAQRKETEELRKYRQVLDERVSLLDRMNLELVEQLKAARENPQSHNRSGSRMNISAAENREPDPTDNNNSSSNNNINNVTTTYIGDENDRTNNSQFQQINQALYQNLADSPGVMDDSDSGGDKSSNYINIRKGPGSHYKPSSGNAYANNENGVYGQTPQFQQRNDKLVNQSGHEQHSEWQSRHVNSFDFGQSETLKRHFQQYANNNSLNEETVNQNPNQNQSSHFRNNRPSNSSQSINLDSNQQITQQQARGLESAIMPPVSNQHFVSQNQPQSSTHNQKPPSILKPTRQNRFIESNESYSPNRLSEQEMRQKQLFLATQLLGNASCQINTQYENSNSSQLIRKNNEAGFQQQCEEQYVQKILHMSNSNRSNSQKRSPYRRDMPYVTETRNIEGLWLADNVIEKAFRMSTNDGKDQNVYREAKHFQNHRRDSYSPYGHQRRRSKSLQSLQRRIKQLMFENDELKNSLRVNNRYQPVTNDY